MPVNEAEALAMLRTAAAEEAQTPAAAPASPADATPPAVPPADTPAPDAPPPADEIAELMTALEARKVERTSKPPDEVAALRAELAELRGRLSAQSQLQPTAPDFAALVREVGEVEALKRVGLDPLEHFSKLSRVAKNPAEVEYRRALAEQARQIEELNAKLGKIEGTNTEYTQQRQADADRQAWNRYLGDAVPTTTYLSKLSVDEQVSRTQRKIEQLGQQGYDVSMLNDSQLAKLVDRDLGAMIQLLSGTDAAAPPTKVPATDGAKQPISSASLTNDLASQSTGQRPMTKAEREAEALRILRTATD